MEIKEFIHEFKGFVGPSRCFVRILEAPEKPVMIITAQPAGYIGTSVTNASEEVAYSVLTALKASDIPPSVTERIRKYVTETKPSAMVDDCIMLLTKYQTIVTITLSVISELLKTIETCKSKKPQEVYWVQIYPNSLGQGRDITFFVTYNADGMEPEWFPMSLEQIERTTGYPQELLKVTEKNLDVLLNGDSKASTRAKGA